MHARPEDHMPEDPLTSILDFEDVPGIDVVDGELIPRRGRLVWRG